MTPKLPSLQFMTRAFRICFYYISFVISRYIVIPLLGVLSKKLRIGAYFSYIAAFY